MDAIIQYTNAVFVALLPIVGDFCEKLDLPAPKPLTTNHVAAFGIGFKQLGEVQGGIWLTNGFSFSFDWGYLYGFQTPTTFSNCQTAEDRPKYTGEVRVAWADAIQIVSNKLQNLQIPGIAGLLKSKLQTNGPVRTKEYTLPYYRMRWSDWPNSIEVGYNANYRRIDSLLMAGLRSASEFGVGVRSRHPKPAKDSQKGGPIWAVPLEGAASVALLSRSPTPVAAVLQFLQARAGEAS